MIFWGVLTLWAGFWAGVAYVAIKLINRRTDRVFKKRGNNERL